MRPVAGGGRHSDGPGAGRPTQRGARARRPESQAEAVALRAEVARLEAEVARLNKVTRVLMDRAESTASVPATDYGLFQTTIMLQNQVRLRTEEARAALRGGEDAALGRGDSAARDMHALRRTAALQIQLLELVVQQRDLGELIDRVADIVDVPIVLFDARGRALHRSPAARPGLDERLWRVYAGLRGTRSVPDFVQDGDDWIAFRDVTVMDRVERVIAAVAAEPRRTGFTDASLSFLQQLAILDALHHRTDLAQDRRERERLLHDVLTAAQPAADLDGRLHQHGFDEAVWRVVAVEAGGGSAAVQHAVDGVLGPRHLPFLSTTLPGLAAALVALPGGGGGTGGELLAELREASARAAPGLDVVAGCSAPLASAAGGPRALQQALVACLGARRDPRSDGAAAFDELGGRLRLLDGLDAAALSDLVRRTFAPLLDYDTHHRTQLYETLGALFARHLAVQDTAAAMHVHRNTLQRRLAHAERLLGIDLNDLDDVVDVRLGFDAAELLDLLPS